MEPFELTSLVLFVFLVSALFFVRRVVRELAFWRGAFISASDSAFIHFKAVEEAVQSLIEGGVDPDVIPFALIGARAADDLLMRSAGERYRNHVASLRKQCVGRGYRWVSEEDLLRLSSP